jgi:hypothetical protein
MRAAAVVLVVLTGCGSNSGGGGGSCPDVARLLRDPSSGACHVVAARDAKGNEGPAQDQAPCQGFCASLPEADCISVAGCHRAVLVGTDPGRSQFFGCWNTAPAARVPSGACVELDADDCSRNDRCAAWYRETTPGTMRFDHCADEPAYQLASHVDRGAGPRSATGR